MIATLDAKNARLEGEVCGLKEQIEVLKHHPTLAAGLAGERLISKLVRGKLTAFVCDHDVVTEKGKLLEIKRSNLSIKYQKNGVLTHRWTWRHVLGNGGKKKFHRLILVGDVDGRYRKLYNDPKSPYVFFDLSRRTAERLMQKGREGREGVIQIITNPDRVTATGARELFCQFQTTLRELERRYGDLTSPIRLLPRKELGK